MAFVAKTFAEILCLGETVLRGLVGERAVCDNCTMIYSHWLQLAATHCFQSLLEFGSQSNSVSGPLAHVWGYPAMKWSTQATKVWQ